jgi:NADH-quinone oxidoreductase subunit E
MTENALTEARRFETVVAVLDRYERDSNRLIPILQAIQEEYRYLPEEIMTYVATALVISPPRYTRRDFYGHLRSSRRARLVKICDGTDCHVKAPEIIVRSRGIPPRRQGDNHRGLAFHLETIPASGLRTRAGLGNHRGCARSRDSGRGARIIREI